MNTTDNKAVFFKRRALKEVIAAFDRGELETAAFRIPFTVIPKESKSTVRCCIYKERAVFRARTLAALGGSVEQDDEATSLNEYAKQALLRKDVPSTPLTVMDIACKGCVKARHLVTEACKVVWRARDNKRAALGLFRLKTDIPKLTPKNAKTAANAKKPAPTTPLPMCRYRANNPARSTLFTRAKTALRKLILINVFPVGTAWTPAPLAPLWNAAN